MIHRILLILAGLFLAGSVAVTIERGIQAARHSRALARELARTLPLLEERLERPESLPVRPDHIRQLREAIEAYRDRGKAYLDKLFPTGTSASAWLTGKDGPYAGFDGDHVALYLELGNDLILEALAAGIGEDHAALQLRSREEVAAQVPARQERLLFELMLVKQVVGSLGDSKVSDLRQLRFDGRTRAGPYGAELELEGLDLAFVAAPSRVYSTLDALLSSGWGIPVFDVDRIQLRRLEPDQWGLHTTRYEAPPIEARIRLRMLVPAGGGGGP